MANTYSQIYFHVVFAVKGRRSHISKDWKDDLYKYISGIISKKDQKLMIINGMPDHLHILIGTLPDCNLSELVRDIKNNSSKWISKEKPMLKGFEWQRGFGAFSVGQSQLPRVINYIKNQEKHHSKEQFREEYIGLLESNEIEYDLRYVFSV